MSMPIRRSRQTRTDRQLQAARRTMGMGPFSSTPTCLAKSEKSSDGPNERFDRVPVVFDDPFRRAEIGAMNVYIAKFISCVKAVPILVQVEQPSSALHEGHPRAPWNYGFQPSTQRSHLDRMRTTDSVPDSAGSRANVSQAQRSTASAAQMGASNQHAVNMQMRPTRPATMMPAGSFQQQQQANGTVPSMVYRPQAQHMSNKPQGAQMNMPGGTRTTNRVSQPQNVTMVPAAFPAGAQQRFPNGSQPQARIVAFRAGAPQDSAQQLQMQQRQSGRQVQMGSNSAFQTAGVQWTAPARSGQPVTVAGKQQEMQQLQLQQQQQMMQHQMHLQQQHQIQQQAHQMQQKLQQQHMQQQQQQQMQQQQAANQLRMQQQQMSTMKQGAQMALQAQMSNILGSKDKNGPNPL